MFRISFIFLCEWIPSRVFCVPGGSLTDAIVKKEMQGEQFSEVELKELLLQVSMGLKYIHSSGLVHLDIKPSMPR